MFLDLGFGFGGLGFRVVDLGFGFWGLGFRVQGLGFRLGEKPSPIPKRMANEMFSAYGRSTETQLL